MGLININGITYGGGLLEASQIVYNNTASRLSATNVQEAIDSLDNTIDTCTSNVTSLTTQVSNMGKTLYPVNSVYVTSTNKNPSSYLGGTWTLFDKEFKSSYTSSSTSGTLFKMNTTNLSAFSLAVVRGGHALRFRLSFTNKVALKDDTLQLGTIDLAACGISGNLTYNVYVNGRTDGGNVMMMGTLAYDTGIITHYDIVGADSVAAGKSDCHYDFTIPVLFSQMSDSLCDKFYWKRTA